MVPADVHAGYLKYFQAACCRRARLPRPVWVWNAVVFQVAFASEDWFCCFAIGVPALNVSFSLYRLSILG